MDTIGLKTEQPSSASHEGAPIPVLAAMGQGTHRHMKRARHHLAKELIALGRATAPESHFSQNEKTLLKAFALSDRAFPEPQECIPTPTAADPSLLSLVQDAFFELFAEEPDWTEECTPKQPEYDIDGSWRFDCECGSVRHQLYALKIRKHWCLCPGPMDAEDLNSALAAFLRHFDLVLADILSRRGWAAEQIKQYRQSIYTKRLLWPHEADPMDLVERYPFVLWLQGPPGLDRDFFCGFEPFARRYEPYDWV